MYIYLHIYKPVPHVCICTYIYIYVHLPHVCICTYMYIYVNRFHDSTTITSHFIHPCVCVYGQRPVLISGTLANGGRVYDHGWVCRCLTMCVCMDVWTCVCVWALTCPSSVLPSHTVEYVYECLCGEVVRYQERPPVRHAAFKCAAQVNNSMIMQYDYAARPDDTDRVSGHVCILTRRVQTFIYLDMYVSWHVCILVCPDMYRWHLLSWRGNLRKNISKAQSESS